jgi:adenine-specific DNA-methyltransferase
MDEVFGRGNFVATNVWQKRYSRENRETIGDVHDYILTYCRNPQRFKAARNLVSFTEKQAAIYKNPNKHPRGRWRPVPMTAQGYRPNQMYEIIAPGGAVHRPPEGRCWSMIESEYKKLLHEGRIYFGKDNNSQPNIIRFLDEVDGVVPWTWWPSEEVGHTDESKKEVMVLYGSNQSFDTPKPERLLHRVLHIATNSGDLVLDSFLGSGTTAAVAHKMGRRWIGVEMGEHAVTHCAVRLRKVIDGEQGGISPAVNWQGGGGFRFCRLGEPVFDGYGRIRPGVTFAALARWIWYRATHQPLAEVPTTPLLGVHQGTAYYLLFNGILGDRRPEGGNVLTLPLLNALPPHEGPRVVYGEACRVHESRLAALHLRFRQLPYQANA